MAATFVTELLVSPIKHGTLWITEAPFVVESAIAGTIEVPAGFLFDGNSLPRLAWIVRPKTEYLEAGCVHDFLYRYGKDRKLADRVYEEILESMGMNKAERKTWYFALRMFGGHAFKNAQKPQEPQ